MTNFDPGGLIMLFTVIPAIIAGILSIGGAHLSSRLGFGDYDQTVVVIIGVLLIGWIGASLVISNSMLIILGVVLSMVGAYAVTRSIRATSYGWVLGVVLMFVAFGILSSIGIYKGVDQTGVPQDVISRQLEFFYFGGLLVFGAIGGGVVTALQQQMQT